jgi:hypothetical protein
LPQQALLLDLIFKSINMKTSRRAIALGCLLALARVSLSVLELQRVQAQSVDLPCTNAQLGRDSCAHYQVEASSQPPVTFTNDLFTFTWRYDDAAKLWFPQYDASQATFTIFSEYLTDPQDPASQEGVITSLPGTFDFLTLSSGISGTETAPEFSVNKNAFDPNGDNPVYRVTGTYLNDFIPSTFEFKRAITYVDLCNGKPIDKCRSYDFSTSYANGVAPSGIQRLQWNLNLATNNWVLTTDPNFPSSVIYYESGFPTDGSTNRGVIDFLPSYVPVAALFTRPLVGGGSQEIYTAPNGLRYEFGVVPDDANASPPIATVFNAALLSEGPGALRCPLNSPQQCLDHSPAPFGGQRPDLSGCFYSYAYAQCFGSNTSPDACQAQTASQDCNNIGCFYDNTLQQCFTSLAQASSIFECGYYSSLIDQNGDNAACAEHGCAFDSATRTCFTPVREGNSTQTQYSEYSSTVFFENPQVLPNSLTFEVDVVVPFVYSSQTSVTPSWPIIQILSDASERIAEYSTEISPNCSTYQFGDGLSPGQFASNTPLATINSYLVQFVSSNNNLNFDTSNQGEVLKRSLGLPRIQPNSLVRSVSYDGARFRYKLSVDLNLAQAQCGARRGVSRSALSQDVSSFVLPISYVEHRQGNAYTQALTTYNVQILTSGEVIIGATAAHRRRLRVQAITFPKAECNVGEARIRLNYTLEVQGIFDQYQFLRTQAIDTKPLRDELPAIGNCYNDRLLTPEPGLVCDRVKHICTLSFATESECRTLRSDGQSFSQCQYGPSDNRIATLGADEPWPTALDGMHTVYALLRLSGENNELIEDQDLLGSPYIYSDATLKPDVLQARVASSAYLGESTDANPFTVQAGLLPVPTAPLSLLNTMQTPTQSDTARLFDGNILNNLPLTIAVVLPAELRRIYDLRLQVVSGRTVDIYPLSANGLRQFPPDGPQALPYASIRQAMIYSAKNDFDEGCGVAQTCRKLPACTNDPTLIGCDGFSIPVSQLVARMPSNGYQFLLPYRIGLTNPDGTPPNARLGGASRRLLSTGDTQTVDSASDKVVELKSFSRSHVRQLLQLSQSGSQQTYAGTVQFTIRIINNGTVIIEQGSINLFSDKLQHKTDAALTFAMVGIPIVFGAAFLYIFVAFAQKRYSPSRKH